MKKLDDTETVVIEEPALRIELTKKQLEELAELIAKKLST
jgi:hypothetical protein